MAKIVKCEASVLFDKLFGDVVGMENKRMDTIKALAIQFDTPVGRRDTEGLAALLKKMVLVGKMKDGVLGTGNRYHQQASNVRTNAQNYIGALWFARKELEAEGYEEATGYIKTGQMAQAALVAAGKTWKDEVRKEKPVKEPKPVPKVDPVEEIKAHVRSLFEGGMTVDDLIGLLQDCIPEVAKLDLMEV